MFRLLQDGLVLHRTPPRTITACVLLLASLLSAGAFAQGGPPTGWSAKKRPPGYGPGIYHFTGLTRTWSFQPYQGSPSSGSETVYQSQDVFGHDIGGSSGFASANVVVSGTSTFKWQWTPIDLNNDGQPDWSLFPPDPLYVLARLENSICRSTLYSPPNADGLNAAGDISDGWGWTDHFDGLPHQIPADPATALPRRKILQTALGGTVAAATMSPSLSVSGTGTEIGARGTVSLQYYETMSAIILSQPDVFGMPRIGDGKNQFYYDSTMPNGQLLVSLEATVPGAGSANTAWLIADSPPLGHVGWAVQPPIPGWSGYTKHSNGDDIWPESPDIHGGISAFAAAYVGLPSSNDDFNPDNGKRTVVLKVDGNDSQRAQIQIFFWPTAQNHGGALGGGEPNWYFYYDQVYLTDAIHFYSPNTFSAYLPNDWIRISDDAWGGSDVPAFQLPSDVPGQPPSLVLWTGRLHVQGVHHYIHVMAHEQGHRKGNQLGLIHPVQGPEDSDWDGDNVPNDNETQLHLDPGNPDTTGAYGGNLKGDDQLIADVHAFGVLRDQKGTWTKDWAVFGLQGGAWGPHHEQPLPATYFGLSESLMPYHPWYFHYTADPNYNLMDPPWGDFLTSIPW